MPNKIQIKRTTTSGLLPNVSNSSNTSYIAAGELAINLTDRKLLSSNGSATFEIGANLASMVVGTAFTLTSGNANFDSGVLFVDGTNNRVGVNNTTPGHALSVTGTTNLGGVVTATANVILGTTTISANGSVGTAGQILTSGGSGNVYWSTGGGGGSPGGANTQIQFNDGGSFGGDAGLTYNKTTDALTVAGALTVNGAVTVPNTAALGNTTITGFANVSTTATIGTGFTLTSGNANFDSGVLFVDGTNNRVGVGNTTPGHVLSVTGATNLGGFVNVSSTVGTNTSTESALRIVPNNLAGAAEWRNIFRLSSYYNGGANGHEFFIKADDNNRFNLISDWGNALRLGVVSNSGAVANAVPTTFLSLTTTAASFSGLTLAAGNTTITGFANVTTTATIGTGFTLTSGNANFDSGVLFVDGTNNRVGIGNTTPGHALSVTGTTNLGGAVTGITTLAAGNTTITGFANVTSTIQGGAGLTIAGAASGITTLAAGNTTITGFVNATSLAVSGSSVFQSNWTTRFQSGSDFVDGTLVSTDIPATASNGDSFIIEITGKSYDGSNPPFKVVAQGYLYNDTIISFSGINYGGSFSSYIRVFQDGGVLKFWWPRISYWNSFNVNVMGMDAPSNSTITRNRVTSITNSTEPTGTKKVTITLNQALRENAWINNKYFGSDGAIYGTIFHDSANSSFYVDPASTSNLSGLTVGTGFTLTSGNANFDSGVLFVDGTNNRVGIGNTTPGHALSVTGTTNLGGAVTGITTLAAGNTTITGNLSASNFSGSSSGTNTGDQTNISGNAGTATTLQTTRSINLVNFNGSANITIPRMNALDDRTIAPADGSAGYVTSFFTSWTNNNNSPYADALLFRTYGDSSGGNDNLVTFRKDAIGMRIWQQTYGSATAFSSFKDVAWTDGTNASGNWGINITGSANSVNFNNLTNKGSGTGTYTTSGDFRAPIFYDSNDTGYYIDAASTSRLNVLSLGTGQTVNGQSHFQWEGASFRNPGDHTPELLIRLDNATTGINGSQPAISLYNENGSDQTTVAMAFVSREANGSGNAVNLAGIVAKKEIAGTSGSWTDGSLTLYTRQGGTRRDALYLDRAGFVQTPFDFRAPIFYDSNDTGYYVDAASTTNLNLLNVVGGNVVKGDGSAGRSTSSSNMNSLSDPSGFYFYDNPTGAPTAEWYNWINSIGNSWTSPNRYGFQIAHSFWDENKVYIRRVQDGAWQSWRRLFHEGSSDVRSGIFYDSNDTGFYIDPNGTSFLSTLIVTGGIGVEGGGASNDPYGRMSVTRPADANNYSYYGLTRAGNMGAGFGLDASNRFWWGQATSGYAAVSASIGMTMTVGGIVTASSDFRAPIFYDSNNTAYYFDATPNINELSGNGKNVLRTNDTYLRINESISFTGGTWFGGTLVRSNGIAIGSSGNLTDSRVYISGGTFNGVNVIALDGATGVGTAADSWRAPIFYKSTNTGYYVNPLGTSNLLGNVYIARDGVSNDTFGGLEIRENTYAGAGDGEAQDAPGINFHWSMRAAARIYMNGSGHFVLAGQSDITNNRRQLYLSDLIATGNVTAYFSDERLKTKIGDIPNAVNIIQSLNGFRYVNNDTAKEHGYESDAVQIGLSAQEVQAVLPEIVELAGFDIDINSVEKKSKTGENYLTVDYSKIVPVLIEAIKEQQEHINRLEVKINSLQQGN